MFFSSKDSWFRKNIKQHNTDNKKKVSWAPTQRIRMISEESCDTEDWSNDFNIYYK